MGFDEFKSSPANLSEAIRNGQILNEHAYGPRRAAPAGSTDNSIWGQLRGWCTVFGCLGTIYGGLSEKGFLTGAIEGIVVGLLFVAAINILGRVLGPVVGAAFDLVDRLFSPGTTIPGLVIGVIAGFVLSSLIGMQGLVFPCAVMGAIVGLLRGYRKRARG